MSIKSNQAISMSAGLSTLYTVFQNTDDIFKFWILSQKWTDFNDFYLHDDMLVRVVATALCLSYPILYCFRDIVRYSSEIAIILTLTCI